MTKTHLLQAKGETLDTFFHGRILVLQKKKGYRFAVDAPLLASSVEVQIGDELCELGTGCGIVSLLLSVRPFRHVTALEIQKPLAGLATRNMKLNGLETKISVVRADLNKFHPRRRFDVVFSNPPYIKKQQGSLSKSAEKSIAKHEMKCDILGVMRAAGTLLKKQGKAFFIFPAKRRRDFEEAAAEAGLAVTGLRFVHSRQGAPAILFLARCGFKPGGPVVRPPLVLFKAGGTYTAEARRIFAGRFDA